MNVDLSKYLNRHSAGSKVKRLLWTITWNVFARFTPRWCLNRWRCFLLKAFGAKLGNGCRVQGSSIVWLPSNLEMGDNCWLDDATKIYNVDKIRLGSNCVISAGAFLCTAEHDISSPLFELKTQAIELGDCVWVASNSIILPGVKIGNGSVIAAGSVATRDIAPWTVVAGNPAHEIKKRNVG